MLSNDIVSFEQLDPDIFLFLYENVSCGYSLEVPHHMFVVWRNKKKKKKKKKNCGYASFLKA